MAQSTLMGELAGYHLRRRPALDVVRGVAVLAVILGHAWAPFTESAGHLGVTLFFALSGFLITRLLLEELDSTGCVNLRSFYLRRVRRLGPAMLTYLAFIALVHEPFRVTAGMLLLSLLQVANFAMASGQNMWALGHTWSLSAEEQFYLLWPALLGVIGLRFTLRRIGIALVAAAVGCELWRWLLVLHGASLSRVLFGPDMRFDAIALGCALAASMDWVSRKFTAVTIRRVGLAGAAALVALTPLSTYVLPWTLPAASVAACAVVAWAASVETLTAPEWVTRPLRWVGKVSYAAYLWHFPISMQLWPVTSWPIRFGVTLPLTLVIAGMSWRFLERPLQARRMRPHHEVGAHRQTGFVRGRNASSCTPTSST